MTKEEIRQFMLAIGCENIQILPHTDWVRASCPLAPWKHENGTDRNPSFGIHAADDGKVPMYNCFSCGSSGTLYRLLHNLTWLSKDRLAEANRILSGIAFDGEEQEQVAPRRRIRVDKYASANLRSREIRRNLPVPEEVLAKYPLLRRDSDWRDVDTAIKWLTETRLISIDVIEEFKLRLFVDHMLGEIGVIFPILERGSERVLDMWVRMIDTKSFFRLNAKLSGSRVDYHAPNLWFGQHCYVTDKPVITVEAPLDFLRLRTLAPMNGLASCGQVSHEQIASIGGVPVLYAGFDADKAGNEMAKKVLRNIEATKRFYLNWAEAGTKPDGTPIKDAGDLQNMSQFRKVFDSKHRIAPPLAERIAREERLEKRKWELKKKQKKKRKRI